MSLIKKTRNDAVKAAVTSYLERRNYPDVDLFSSTNSLSRSAEQMAVATIVQCEASRANSILFSCINNDPGQYETQYSKLVNFIKDIKVEKIKNELLGLLSPLLCHLYLEMLRGGHGGQAQMFLKKHSATLPQKDLSYHQPIDGNLPSALYRPNSLEQLFNSLQNGTIDNETPEKDYMNQILDDIGSIYTLQEVEARPSIAAFRSCKYDIFLSQDALNVLKTYLAKHGHVLLIQVLQTWFHIDINNDTNKNTSDDEDHLDDEYSAFKMNTEEKVSLANDIFSKCNGHAEYQTVDKELKDLQDAIKGVRESMAPLKLYKVAAPDSYLVCAKTDPHCNILCGGFSNSEIRLWDLGQNNIKRRINHNISEVELACFMPSEPPPEDNTLQVGTGLPLRGHTGPIQAVSVLPQEQLVLSASYDNTMRAWRLYDYSCASVYRGHNYPIWCMDVSKNGLFIVTGSHDRTAKLWSLDRTFPVRVFVGHMSDVTHEQDELHVEDWSNAVIRSGTAAEQQRRRTARISFTRRGGQLRNNGDGFRLSTGRAQQGGTPQGSDHGDRDDEGWQRTAGGLARTATPFSSDGGKIAGGAYYAPAGYGERLGTGLQAYGVRLTVETQTRDVQELDETRMPKKTTFRRRIGAIKIFGNFLILFSRPVMEYTSGTKTAYQHWYPTSDTTVTGRVRSFF